MSYDKKTGTITITSDDPKELQRDMYKHFEEVTRQLTQEPNCPSEIIEEYEKLKNANKALDAYEKLNTLVKQLQHIKQSKSSQILPAPSIINGEGGTIKWIAVFLNLVLLSTTGYLLITGGDPNDEELVLITILVTVPLVNLLALTRIRGESWLGLYLKRKSLEEKQKIKKLNEE